MFFSVIAYPVFVMSTKEIRSESVLIGNQINEVTLATHLNEVISKDDKRIKDGETMAREYVTTMVKTSYFLDDKKMPFRKGDSVEERNVDVSETFLEVENYPNDCISYYFYNFKPSSPDLDFYLYGGVDYSSKKEEAIYLAAFGYKSKDFFFEKTTSIPIYQQLSPERAVQLNDRFVYGVSDQETDALYNDLTNRFLRARQMFVDEMENNYSPYIELQRRFSRSYSTVALGGNLAAILSFVLGFSLMEFLLPLFLKNHRTLSARMMKVGYSKLDEGAVDPLALAIKGLTRFVLYFGSMFFAFNLMGITSFAFFPFQNFSFSYLYFGSLFAALISFFFGLFSKRHQCLPEFLSNILTKDLNAFEANEPLEEKVITNE